MKKVCNISSCLGVMLLVALGSCSSNQDQNGFTLKGSIKGVESGKVKLTRYNDVDRTTTAIDSTELTNGNFELKGKLDHPEMLTLQLDSGNWSFNFFMENADVTVEADTTGATYYDWSNYGGSKGANIKDFTVNGSINHNQFIAYETNPENRKYDSIFKELNKRYDAETDKALKEKIREEFAPISEQKNAWEKQWLTEFIKANPNATVGAYLFYNYFRMHRDMPIEELAAPLSLFTGEAAASVYAKNLKDLYKKRQALMPGSVAPDFTALKRDSTSFTLSSTRGKYVLIDFWASWCAPCRASIPHWKELYSQYHDKGLEIVAITNDNRWNDWFKALDEEQMPWIQVADEFPVKNMPARISTLYMTPHLPSYVLLDKEGKIISHLGSKDEITKMIKELLD